MNEDILLQKNKNANGQIVSLTYDILPPSHNNSLLFISHILRKSVYVKERKIVERLVKYWCIPHYHKCKVEYIELGVMKVVLIRVIIEEKKSVAFGTEGVLH